MATGIFMNVKSFAKFNAMPKLFDVSEPYQLGLSDVNGRVFVKLASGRVDDFKARVEQFGGVFLAKLS